MKTKFCRYIMYNYARSWASIHFGTCPLHKGIFLQVYGLTYTDVQEEPMLETKRRQLITTAAMLLDKTHMIRYNERTGDLNITGKLLLQNLI